MCKFNSTAVLLVTAGFVTGCVQQAPIADATGTQLGDQQSLLLVDSEQRIGPEGGQVTFTPSNSDVIQKAVLEIPAGALTEPVDFSMKLVTRALIPSNGPRPVATIEIEPSGTRFLVPAKLTYHYNWQAIDDKGGIDEAFLEIAYFDERLSMLLPLRRAGLDTQRQTVAAELEHLSTYPLIVPTIFPKPISACQSTQPGIVPVVFVHGIQVTQCQLFYLQKQLPSFVWPLNSNIYHPACTFGAMSPAVISAVTVDGEKVCKDFVGSDLPTSLKNLPIYQINYFTMWDINSAACALKSAIARVLDAHPGYKSQGVKIVAHSMGGLVTRAYIQDKGKVKGWYDNEQYPGLPNVGSGFNTLSSCKYNEDIYQVMTLGTPHGGGNWSELPDLLVTPDCSNPWVETPALEQMENKSDFLNDLNDELPNDLNGPPPQYIAYFGDKDGSVLNEKCFAQDGEVKSNFNHCYYGLGSNCCAESAAGTVCGASYGSCYSHGSMISHLHPAGVDGAAQLAVIKAKKYVIDGPDTNSGQPGLFNDVGHCIEGLYEKIEDWIPILPEMCGEGAHGIASIDDTQHPLYKIVCKFIGGCDSNGNAKCVPNCCGGYCDDGCGNKCPDYCDANFCGTNNCGDFCPCQGSDICDQSTNKCVQNQAPPPDPPKCQCAANESCNNGYCIPEAECAGYKDNVCKGNVLLSCVSQQYYPEDCAQSDMVCGYNTIYETYSCIAGPKTPPKPPPAPIEPTWVSPLASCAKSFGFKAWNGAMNGYHMAVDLKAGAGTTVMAPAAGIVKETQWHGGYAGVVIIEHNIDGEYMTSVMGHLKCLGPGNFAKGAQCAEMLVKEGQAVQPGTPVAYIAANNEDGGDGWGPHLHWGIRKGKFNNGESCKKEWTYAGYVTCDDAWIDANWYNPLNFIQCVGGGAYMPSSPILLKPENAVARRSGQQHFSWLTSPSSAEHYVTIRKTDLGSCEKIGGEDGMLAAGGQLDLNITEPGSYRWTVFIKHSKCPDGVCAAVPQSFHVYDAPTLLTPAKSAKIAPGDVDFTWTPGDPAVPHTFKLRDITYDNNGPLLADFVPAPENQYTLSLGKEGTYRWIASYPLIHCADTSGCACLQQVALEGISIDQTFQVDADGESGQLIGAPPEVTVTQPVAGLEYEPDQPVEIAWEVEAEEVIDHVEVVLMFADVPCDSDEVASPIVTQSISGGDPGAAVWTVPTNLPAQQYQIRATAWDEKKQSGYACSPAFEVVVCQPDCQGKICGDDGCGVSCGECPYGQSCHEGGCECWSEECTTGDSECLSTNTIKSCVQVNGCAKWLPSGYCKGNEQCVDGECLCAPACGAEECGDDGCGGSCGSCDPGESCAGGVCVAGCNKNCSGKECGPDGCGNECGFCSGEKVCQNGSCKPFCEADCQGKTCGPDGCGGSCGECENWCFACGAGQCVYQNLCDDADPCSVDICEPGGLCGYETVDSGPCDDADACSLVDVCQAGDCVGVVDADCDDYNPCTVDLCTPGLGCVHSKTEGLCDDGNACTEGDVCKYGWCVGTQHLDCNDGNVCTAEVCMPQWGCTYATNNVECNDGDPCTLQDWCSAGHCSSELINACDDGNQCTHDGCLPGAGCFHMVAYGPCSDGSLCTVADTCVEGACVGMPLDCDDGDPCTIDACHPDGTCQHDHSVGSCDDGDPCTGGDSCATGQCVGVALDCDDGHPCTADACDPKEGCFHVPDSSLCEDDTACEYHICDAVNGCVSVSKSGNCDDGDPCTEKDSCTEGDCAGQPVVCDEGSACEQGECVALPATGGDDVGGEQNLPDNVVSPGTPPGDSGGCAVGRASPERSPVGVFVVLMMMAACLLYGKRKRWRKS